MTSHEPLPAAVPAAEPFRELYAREYPNIAGYCFVLTRDTELAHDLAQEAFTRLFSRLLAVREPRPFLFRVATNLAHDAFRDRTKQAAIVAALPHLADVSANPIESLELREAVERLPDRHRDAVLLHYFADLPVAEVAAAMRRPAGTVKRLLSEARGQLAIALEATT